MLEAFGISDVGSVRANNEDYYLLAPEHGLFVVADGMGGAQAGEHASRLAAETVVEVIGSHHHADAAALCYSFEEANRRVMAAASRDVALDGMGTTLVAALQVNGQLLIASVGDSRAYVYRDQELVGITEDQTWVHEVGRRLGIDEVSLKHHPMKHVLTMAIGVSSQLRVHSYTVPLQPGTQILLCSDGLHGVVEPNVIGDALAGDAPLSEKATKLIEAAKSNGAPDNITAILLCVR